MTEGLPLLSASKIKTYKTCARQYYYRYVVDHNNRPLEDKNVAALLGSALHSAIELKYKEDKSPIFTFQEYMQQTLEQWEADDRNINALGYYNTAIKVGKQILKDFNWDAYTPIELEYSFTLPFPNKDNPIVMITGLIDMITSDGDVIDHKSASSAPSQVDVDNDAQFIIYAWAYEQIYGKPARRVIWNHLRTNKEIVLNTDNLTNRLIQLESDIQALINARHYARINISDTCKKRCSYFSKCFHVESTEALVVEETE
jgi:hypothetical protein